MFKFLEEDIASGRMKYTSAKSLKTLYTKLTGKQLLFQPDDILIFRAEKTSSLPKDILGSNDVPEAAVEEANVFFLYRCCDKNSELYRMCKKLVDESNIRGNGHAIYQGIITEVENKINQLC